MIPTERIISGLHYHHLYSDVCHRFLKNQCFLFLSFHVTAQCWLGQKNLPVGLGSCLVILSFFTIYRRVNRSEDNDFDRLKATSTREKNQRLTDFKYYIVVLFYAKLTGRVFDIVAFYIAFLVVVSFHCTVERKPV